MRKTAAQRHNERIDRIWELTEALERKKHERRCPFCGSTNTVRGECWHAISDDDPVNETELTEYQCRNENCGRSFWT